ncbi:hypothetical protein BpHYR1_022824 [Brachionus plicatilis]|uniref:Uncharacterized protein n=1 Tax=Brachionus plicatilis TaxID=10195 RepID=A0A3M7QLP0_BRAPC|nr:hypothetical protein BpHYR1_022824 [Brachionus plicatilis]
MESPPLSLVHSVIMSQLTPRVLEAYKNKLQILVVPDHDLLYEISVITNRQIIYEMIKYGNEIVRQTVRRIVECRKDDVVIDIMEALEALEALETEGDNRRIRVLEREDDKTDSVTLVKSKSNDLQQNDLDSDAESSFGENLITIDENLSVLNINAAEKAVHYREKAMTAISTSQEALNVVKKALSKHANPVPCEICGELMKNVNGNF